MLCLSPYEIRIPEIHKKKKKLSWKICLQNSMVNMLIFAIFLTFLQTNQVDSQPSYQMHLHIDSPQLIQ